MAALHRTLYKVSFHEGGSRGAGLLTEGAHAPWPPGYAPENNVFLFVFSRLHLHVCQRTETAYAFERLLETYLFHQISEYTHVTFVSFCVCIVVYGSANITLQTILRLSTCIENKTRISEYVENG